jgi:hypothetical protein
MIDDSNAMNELNDYFIEEYRSLSRKQGAMAQKIAKTAQEGGMRKTADYIHKTGGIRNAFRRKLGLKPKERPERSNPENVKKQKKATLRAARMAAVLDKHKPGVEQNKELKNREVGVSKHTKNNISHFDRVKTRKEDLMLALIGDLIENAELAKINREIRQRMSRGQSITDLAARAKELQQTANTHAKGGALLKTLQGKDKEKSKTPGRGQSPQKEKDANTSTGTISKVEASKRKVGNNVVGGEGPNTSTGGRYGNLGTGRGGGTQSRRNKTTNRSGGNLGARSEKFEADGNLIEANPPKPNALQTIGKKHEKRTHGMTARSSYDKDGNIKLGDVFLPPSERSRGRGGSYVDGIAKFADKTSKSVSLKQDPEKGQEDNLNRFYAKRGFKADDKKPGRYVRKPKTNNEEIILRFRSRIEEKYAAGKPLSKPDQQRVKNIGRAGRGDTSWVGTPEDTGTWVRSKRPKAVTKSVKINRTPEPTTNTPKPVRKKRRLEFEVR